jgi:beta-galactosidase GanA
MFLHGCGIMDYWWWPDEESEFDDSSLKHSSKLPLEEVGVVMRTALDVRRLGRQIAAFPDAPAQIALLYSRSSLVQQYPKAEGNKTPYTLEMEKTYEAAVRLDTPVGFISSRQVREGLAGKYAMIVIPGCRYVEQDVFAKITEWVSAGGTLVITPSSLAADEYNRKRDYLKTLGLELVSEELPELLAGEAKPGTQQTGELDFIQGPVVKTVVSKEPKRKITGKATPITESLSSPLGAGALGSLEAAGIIQTVKPSPGWRVGATYDADRSPAILWRPMGRGRIVYLAAQLTVDSRRGLLDRLMTQARFLRPIRVAGPDSPYVPGVESRTVRQDDGWLTYLANTTGSTVQVKLSAAKPIGEIHDLNRDIQEPTGLITLQPYETKILKIK